jgi:hypothetical protein
LCRPQIIFGLAVFLSRERSKAGREGLPTASPSRSPLVLPLPEAIALISLPTVVANVWQAAVGGKFRLMRAASGRSSCR